MPPFARSKKQFSCTFRQITNNRYVVTLESDTAENLDTFIGDGHRMLDRYRRSPQG